MMNEDRKSKHDTTSPMDRRAEYRTAPVYRPVLIETDEFSGFCLVRNLSPSGMMGQVYAQFAEQQPVTIWFHPDRGVAGTIAWSEGDHVGIRFTETIYVESVLSELSAEYVLGRANRPPRLPIEIDGELTSSGQAMPVRIHDISQRGIKFSVPALRAGAEVEIRLPGMEPRKAHVRWVQNGSAGLNFDRPIDFEMLARWIIDLKSAADTPESS